LVRKWILFAMGVVLLTACASGQGANPTPVPTAVPAATPTALPTLPSNVTPPAPTPLPGSTPVPWWGGTVAVLDIEPKYIVAPTGIKVAPDGTIYFADRKQQRLVHLQPIGQRDSHVLQVWGEYSESKEGVTPTPGTFNEPWGLALGPDGSVYVADLWHHRIQKFDAEGKFLLAWGEFGQGSDPFKLFGPRDIVVSPAGLVFVTDTGNKRVVVYDQEGHYVSETGGAGSEPGKFDEPVGLALDADGNLWVADQWNRRVQTFAVGADGTLTWKAAWPVQAWKTFGEEHKPFLCTLGGHVFVADPETGSVLQYTAAGEYVRTYDIPATLYLNAGIANGIAAAPDGGLWVSYAGPGTGVLVKIFPQP
jgi:sugar lactone lactonase YvrE